MSEIRFETSEEHHGLTCHECTAEAVIAATGSAWLGYLRLGTVSAARCTACGHTDTYPDKPGRFP